MHLYKPCTICSCNAGHFTSEVPCPVYMQAYQLVCSNLCYACWGETSVARKSPLCSCYKDMGTVLCCPHFFPQEFTGSISVFWPQVSTVFRRPQVEPELDKPAFLWGGERLIGKQGFGITSGLGCWGVWEGWTEHSSGGVSWVVQTV